MVKISQHDNLITLELVAPPTPDDFDHFIKALDHALAEQTPFRCLMITDGTSHFTEQQKRELTRWFKQKKPLMRQHCRAFCRIVSTLKLSQKLSSKALALALGIPYYVCTTKTEAQTWLNHQQQT